MWWCHLPQDRELTSPELAAVADEELRKKLLERYKGWHEPIGTFLANTPDIIRTNIYEAPLPRLGTRVAWFLSATPRMP